MPKKNSSQEDSIIYCRVCINNSDEWVHGILTYINVNRGIAEIFLPARYFKEYLAQGNCVTVKSMDQNNEILFYGNIAKKVISIKKQSITVQIDKVLNFENNRKYERFNVNFYCIILTPDGEYSGKMMDISLNGCMIYTNYPLADNSDITIKSYISPGTELVFHTKVLHQKDSKDNIYSYGFQMSGIDNDNNIVLNELIAHLVAQKNHIEHEWKIFNRLKYSVYSVSVAVVFFIVFYIFASNVN